MRAFERGELKIFEERIKLIKSAYSNNITAMVLPEEPRNGNTIFMDIKDIDNDPQNYFRNSIFKLQLPVELSNTAIMIDKTIEAIKDKVTIIDIRKDGVYLSGGKTNKEFEIAKVLEEPIINRELQKVYQFYDNYEIFNTGFENNPNVSTKKEIMVENLVERLLNYEVVTIRPNENGFDDFALIVTKKSFPNVKKMNSLSIEWSGNSESEIVTEYIISKFEPNVLFIQALNTLRC